MEIVSIQKIDSKIKLINQNTFDSIKFYKM